MLDLLSDSHVSRGLDCSSSSFFILYFFLPSSHLYEWENKLMNLDSEFDFEVNSNMFAGFLYLGI